MIVPVSTTVASPAVSITTLAVFVLAHRAGPGRIDPTASRITAANRSVSPTLGLAVAGVTVITSEPSVAVIGIVPASGASVMLAVGFTPATIVSTLVPRCVSVAPSKARTVNNRPEPAGTAIDPDATPAITGMLKTIVGVMSVAETSTTSDVAVKSPTGTTTTIRPIARPSGPTSRGPVALRSQAVPTPSTSAAVTVAASRRRREARLCTGSFLFMESLMA